MGMKLDLFLQQTFIEFLPTTWPRLLPHQGDGLVGDPQIKQVITTEGGECVTWRWRMFLEHTEGTPPPDPGDQRSFPEVTLVENLRNCMPFEVNVSSNTTETPGRVDLNGVSK